jgi:hypothetical protein
MEQLQELKAIPQDIDSRIATTLIKGQNDALGDLTIHNIERALKQLARHANLLNPEEVKHYVAIAKTNKRQSIANDTKNRLLYSNDKFCKYARAAGLEAKG